LPPIEKVVHLIGKSADLTGRGVFPFGGIVDPVGGATLPTGPRGIVWVRTRTHLGIQRIHLVKLNTQLGVPFSGLGKVCTQLGKLCTQQGKSVTGIVLENCRISSTYLG